ncbi:MAG: bifunctional phosphopantothenoylcysteine decarboxylase/phosphopantothenate--cysteine ligase CoaBC [Actinobacteria bacterium]|nr:bifunctional phosphopantothenoylcysteine decarboxylase/phosphopantothenate--cysteine ligase CoaBC [Actinomycetota bacterium]
MAEVVLAVSGGIAAYKAVDLLRTLQHRGHGVTVVMTKAATRFVGPPTFAALSGRPVGTALIGPAGRAGYDHLDLARGADVMVVAPATANVLSRLAAGAAGDLTTATALAMQGRLVVAPAMNTRMWEHPATRENLARLEQHGVCVVAPEHGLLADGETGAGRLADTATIADAVEDIVARHAAMVGIRVLVTGGGTREPIDAVRFVGNRSSGRMAVAIAEAARDRGAEVTLIAANLAVAAPSRVGIVSVGSAAELHEAARAHFGGCHVLVMAAAVADYRPTTPTGEKFDKSAAAGLTIALERTDDILMDLASRRRGQILIGFAAEHGPAGLDRARAKLRRKQLDMIVHNDIADASIGFESPDNAITILGPVDAERSVGPVGKRACADALLDAAAPLLATLKT